MAEVTGFSYTNVYYYFKDLNALLLELRLDMIEDMITELSSILTHKEDSVDEILESLCTYVNYYFDHPNVFSFFYFYPFIQPSDDESYLKPDEKFNGLWQTSFNRLLQEEESTKTVRHLFKRNI